MQLKRIVDFTLAIGIQIRSTYIDGCSVFTVAKLMANIIFVLSHD